MPDYEMLGRFVKRDKTDRLKVESTYKGKCVYSSIYFIRNNFCLVL